MFGKKEKSTSEKIIDLAVQFKNGEITKVDLNIMIPELVNQVPMVPTSQAEVQDEVQHLKKIINMLEVEIESSYNEVKLENMADILDYPLLEKDNKTYVVVNASKFCMKMGLNPNEMSKLIRGVRETYEGYSLRK